MGKVTDIIKRIRGLGHTGLLNRYKHIVRAQAIREYLAAKEDKELSLEVNLAGEEAVGRMSKSNAIRIVPDEEENDEK